MDEYKELFRIVDKLMKENDKYKAFTKWIIDNYANGSSDFDFCNDVYEKANEVLKEGL